MCSPAVIDHVLAASSPRVAPTGGSPGTGVGHFGAAAAQTCFSGVEDLTHPLPEDFPSANGERWLELEDFLTFDENGINFRCWRVHEHIGTHIDAPIHFSREGDTAEQIPVMSLVVPLAVVDICARAEDHPDAELTPADILAWEARHGPLPDGCCVAMNSGWDRRATGPGYRNVDGSGRMHFPGFHDETAQMLLDERRVVGIGVDTLSVDIGPSTRFPVHRRWLPAGRWAAEGLANLAALPPAGATIVVGAPTVVGATGGPSRILALV
jgi:kynurenine formamidase